MLTQKVIDDIRGDVKIAEQWCYDSTESTWAYQAIIDDVSLLIEHIEGLEGENARLHSILLDAKDELIITTLDDGVIWRRCSICGELLDGDIGHVEDCPLEDWSAYQANNERLREALSKAARVSRYVSSHSGNGSCRICYRLNGHADDCPFKVLERE